MDVFHTEVYIGLSLSGSFFYENNGSVTVAIEKSGLTDQTLSVLLSTVNGTATGQYIGQSNLRKCIHRGTGLVEAGGKG